MEGPGCAPWRHRRQSARRAAGRRDERAWRAPAPHLQRQRFRPLRDRSPAAGCGAALKKVAARIIRVQRMTRKWGSCSTTGTTTLAADLYEQKPGFQDFVIAHELLHLRVQGADDGPRPELA